MHLAGQQMGQGHQASAPLCQIVARKESQALLLVHAPHIRLCTMTQVPQVSTERDRVISFGQKIQVCPGFVPRWGGGCVFQTEPTLSRNEVSTAVVLPR